MKDGKILIPHYSFHKKGTFCDDENKQKTGKTQSMG